MKTRETLHARKLDRNALKNVKGGNVRGRVCCTSNEEGQCCEWAINEWNCRGIQC